MSPSQYPSTGTEPASRLSQLPALLSPPFSFLPSLQGCSKWSSSKAAGSPATENRRVLDRTIGPGITGSIDRIHGTMRNAMLFLAFLKSDYHGTHRNSREIRAKIRTEANKD